MFTKQKAVHKNVYIRQMFKINARLYILMLAYTVTFEELNICTFTKKLVCVKHKTTIELSSNCLKNYIAHAYLQIKCFVLCDY